MVKHYELEHMLTLTLIPGAAAGLSQGVYTAVQGARGLGRKADIAGAAVIAALTGGAAYGGLLLAQKEPKPSGATTQLTTDEILASSLTSAVVAGVLSYALSHMGSEGTKKSVALHALGKGAAQLVVVSLAVAGAHEVWIKTGKK